MRILVVDDSKVMRLKLKSIIGGSGIPVSAILEASHGREGIAVLDKEAVDLVITDINMPEMDGREFLRILSTRTFPRPLCRIVCTTETPQGVREELNGYGVNLYIEKPFDPVAVTELLKSVATTAAAVR